MNVGSNAKINSKEKKFIKSTKNRIKKVMVPNLQNSQI